MPQSEVPNAIAMLDDVRWKLDQALKCAVNGPVPDLALITFLSSSLRQIQQIQAADVFKPPLCDTDPQRMEPCPI